MELELDDSRNRHDEDIRARVDVEARSMQRFHDDQAAEQTRISAAKATSEKKPSSAKLDETAPPPMRDTAESPTWKQSYEVRRGDAGETVYHRDGEKQFTDHGPRIVCHGTSEQSTRDFVALLKERYGDHVGLRGGTPERQDEIMREMARQGVVVGSPELRARYATIAAEHAAKPKSVDEQLDIALKSKTETPEQARRTRMDARLEEAMRGPQKYEPPANATRAQLAHDAAHTLANSPELSNQERDRARRAADGIEKQLAGKPTLHSLREASGQTYDVGKMRERAKADAPHLAPQRKETPAPRHEPPAKHRISR